jgi:hypothetical protein
VFLRRRRLKRAWKSEADRFHGWQHRHLALLNTKY